MKKFLVLISVVLFPILVFANGFQINEQGAKALGMGGAFVAQADDPTAVYFNPAGITQLEGMQISLGVSPIHPYATFESDSGVSTDADDKTFFIPNFYATLKATEKVSVGLGVFSNFGLATEWPDDWEGRYITGGTKAEIVTLTINPNIAYKINEKLSIAVGVDFQKMDVTLDNKVKLMPYSGYYLLLSSDGDSSLEGKDDWATGWNVALHYKITENWKFGMSYRSKIKHKFKDGTATLELPSGSIGYYDNTGTFVPVQAFPGATIQKTGSTNITLPDIFYIGTSYQIGKFIFELDGQWTGWSSYDELKVEFEDGSSITKDKGWNDVWAIRFGVQYKVSELLDLRAGIIRDYSPIPDETLDPLVPSGDRWLYAIGFGLNFKHVTLDFAYNYLDDEQRDFNNEVGSSAPYGTPAVPTTVTGTFKDVHAHIFGFNFTYKF